MRDFPFDQLIFSPGDIDPGKLPIGGDLGEDTYVLGAFNPGMCRLPSGNLLLMVRVAESLKENIVDGQARILRFDRHANSFAIDTYPVKDLDLSDPRKFRFKSEGAVYALTSLSWLLPVELDSQGTKVLQIHYEKKILPNQINQELGVEDARITQIGSTYYMTACSVSASRHSTCLYSSSDGLNYSYQGMILDHQNKDMVIFPEMIDTRYFALTRPQGELYFKSHDKLHRGGAGMHMAVSPDLYHWRPVEDFIQSPRYNSLFSRKLGSGPPPLRTAAGWLVLFHGVSDEGIAGKYRTFWMLLDIDNPEKVIAEHVGGPLMEAAPGLTAHLKEQIYLEDVVFTTGLIRSTDHYIVASGELDLCCRMTHIPHSVFDQTA